MSFARNNKACACGGDMWHGYRNSLGEELFMANKGGRYYAASFKCNVCDRLITIKDNPVEYNFLSKMIYGK